MRRPYYLFSNGRLRRKDSTLFLERATDIREADDLDSSGGMPSGAMTGQRAAIPVEQVDSLYLFGEIDVNSKLVTFLAQQGIPAFFFDYYGNYTATLLPRAVQLSGQMKIRQARTYLARARRMPIARESVTGASHNILRILGYYANRVKGESGRQIEAGLREIESLSEGVEDAASPAELMGVEGAIRHVYYRCWPYILQNSAAQNFSFTARKRRPPSNEVNALISFGNALCYALVLRQIRRTALDPTISFLHEPGDRRYSLALDVSEVFKPVLVDRLIFRVLNKGLLRKRDFEARLGGVYLRESGRRVFVEQWDSMLQQTVRHRRLNRSVSYTTLVRHECHRLARALLDPKDPYRAFRMWW